MSSPPKVLDRLSILADSTRSRILLLLDRHELTVGELCTILQLPQSTVSPSRWSIWLPAKDASTRDSTAAVSSTWVLISPLDEYRSYGLRTTDSTVLARLSSDRRTTAAIKPLSAP